MPTCCQHFYAFVTCGGDICDLIQCLCMYCVCCHDKPDDQLDLSKPMVLPTKSTMVAYPLSPAPQSAAVVGGYGAIPTQEQPTVNQEPKKPENYGIAV
ncbi:Aste57867_22881 [Aphanomyces stellatus]|uniref:Aste57867_22881 protein n=1 Tax=Aphanomyces stellatus TaxID=120398 RepID=A0A485LMB0_9STRA|nr:hypothetical protein As57867_022810 [Aphanomyces stellatus]VFT99531.1 Aste57867_22881 [Aphanomyces stellatus]